MLSTKIIFSLVFDHFFFFFFFFFFVIIQRLKNIRKIMVNRAHFHNHVKPAASLPFLLMSVKPILKVTFMVTLQILQAELNAS